MKILMINPSFLEEVWSMKYLMKVYGRKSFAPPLALMTVAALLPNNWEIRLIDLNVGKITGADLDWADTVMFSAMNCQKDSLLPLIEEARVRSKTVVCGGPYPTFTPQELLDTGCNILVRGEVENEIHRLVQAIKNQTKTEIIEGSTRPDVTLSPPPRFDLVRLADYGSAVIQTSRGCPVDCEFCSAVALYGRKPRYKTSAQVVSELDALYGAGHRGTVFVSDDNFIADKASASSILNSIVQWQYEKRKPFNFFTQAGIGLGSDPEMMRLMNQARFEGVLVGIESPDEEVLRIAGKGPNLRSPVRQLLKNMNENGINVVGGFVVGLDGESEDSQDRICEFVESISLPIAQILPLKIWPETRLWHRLKSAGRLIPDKTSGVHEMDLNYIPETSEDKVLQQVTGIYSRLYEPSNYLTRAFHYVKMVGAPQSLQLPIGARIRAMKGNSVNMSVKDQLYNVRAFLSLVCAIGLRPSLIRQFWGQLANIIKERPERFEQYIELCLGGESMRRYAEIVKHRIHAVLRPVG
ncbi:MAG: B12-binding domain-containing radical SAM protein [Desulfomonilaceae bacterium]